MLGFAVGGEFLFEGLNFGAEDEIVSVDHPVDRITDFVVQFVVLLLKVDEWNRHGL